MDVASGYSTPAGLNDFIIIIFYKYYDLSEVVLTFL
jgi:hypothetical protein